MPIFKTGFENAARGAGHAFPSFLILRKWDEEQ